MERLLSANASKISNRTWDARKRRWDADKQSILPRTLVKCLKAGQKFQVEVDIFAGRSFERSGSDF